MKFLLGVLITLFVVTAAPALACETCILPGQKTPNGLGPFDSAICWASDTGQWSSCSGGDSQCTTQDPENSCPVGGGGGCSTPPCPPPIDPGFAGTGHLTPYCSVDVSGRCSTGADGQSAFAL